MSDNPAQPPPADPRQIQDLANRYWNRLYQIAFMMVRNAATAEDITQETLVQAMTHLDEFRGDSDLFVWACSILVNLCRTKMRPTKERTAVQADAIEDAPQSGPGPATRVVLQESYRRAALALDRLDDALREAFILHYIEGLPYETIASICGISEGAARLRAMRARQSLSQELHSLLEPEVRRRMETEPSEPEPATRSRRTTRRRIVP